MNYSRVKVLSLINGCISGSRRKGRWNYSFMVMHFTIFIVLVSMVIALSKQIKYSMSGYTGIHPENVLVVQLNTNELKKNFTAISSEMEQLPGVIKTAGGDMPIEKGDAAVVLPNEMHSVRNTGKEKMSIICLVPLVDGKMPVAQEK